MIRLIERGSGNAKERRKMKGREECGNVNVGGDKKDSPHLVEGNYVRWEQLLK